MMLKSILVALDGSADCQPSLDLGLAWAERHGSLLVGCAVVDEPGIRVSEATVFSEGFAGVDAGEGMLLARARSQMEEILRLFEERCGERNVRCQTRLDYGTPHVRLVAESHRYDLVLMGQRTHFEHGWTTESDETLHRVIQECPRPVVIVPALPADPAGGPVLLAFDGSLRSSQALYDFTASGLGRGREVHVLSVDREHEVAERLVEKALMFLHHHEIDAQAHPFDGAFQPQHAILGALNKLSASLLVIGAYGHSPLRKFFLGSTTRELLENAGLPVFCAH